MNVHLLMINCKLIISYSKSFIIHDSYLGKLQWRLHPRGQGNALICRQFSLCGCGCAFLCLPQNVLSCPGDTTTALKASTTATNSPAGPCGHQRCCVAALQGVSVTGSRWDCMHLPSLAPSPTPWLKFSANSILSSRLTDVTPRKVLSLDYQYCIKRF